MSKILILANFDLGLYKFRKELIKELLDRDKQVTIALPYGELVEPLIDMGCTFIDTPMERRGMNPLKDFMLFLRYLRLVNKVKPDLVITYTIKPNIYGGIVSRLLKIPYAINITGLGTAFEKEGFVRSLVIFLYKVACKKSKGVFFENEENLQSFLGYKIINSEQGCRLNGAGVNLEEYTFTEYPQEDGAVRFLFIGRVMKEKGVDELFEAAKRIKQEYPNAEFDIVGPYEDNYKELVEKLHSQGIINYYGYQKDVRPFIKKCHCFVLPSYHEGMANTNLECAASGRPVITSNIHGCLEAVEDGVTGYLCEKQNSKDLYTVIKKFTELNYDYQKTMGLSGRIRMERLFDRKRVIDSTINRLF